MVGVIGHAVSFMNKVVVRVEDTTIEFVQVEKEQWQAKVEGTGKFGIVDDAAIHILEKALSWKPRGGENPPHT